jgi:hypothetical protein
MSATTIYDGLDALIAYLKQAQASEQSEDEVGAEPGVRMRGGKPPAPITASERNTYNDTIIAEISHFKSVLSQQPELLTIFEKSIRDEYGKRTRRDTLASFAINGLCTILGTLFGVFLQIHAIK